MLLPLSSKPESTVGGIRTRQLLLLVPSDVGEYRSADTEDACGGFSMRVEVGCGAREFGDTIAPRGERTFRLDGGAVRQTLDRME